MRRYPAEASSFTGRAGYSARGRSVRGERFTELEEMILAGWGDRRQDQIPQDWRTRRPHPIVSDFFTHDPQAAENKQLAAELMERYSRGAPPVRRNKPWDKRIAFRQAAMRARLNQAQSPRRREYLKETGRQEHGDAEVA